MPVPELASLGILQKIIKGYDTGQCVGKGFIGYDIRQYTKEKTTEGMTEAHMWRKGGQGV